MTTLADTFLEDLDDLEDEDEAQEENGVQSSTQGVAGQGQEGKEGGGMEEEGEDGAEPRAAASAGRGGSSTGADSRKRPRKADGDQPAVPASTVTLSDVAKLPFDPSFSEHIKRIRKALDDDSTGEQCSRKGLLEGDPVYKLIVDSNNLMVQAKEEIGAIHRFVSDLYSAKFPELFGIVHAPLDYLRVVKRIGREEDITAVDLTDILPPASIMVVSVSGSASSGAGISEEDLSRVLEACDTALDLAEQHDVMLRFVESRMSAIAPNVSALVGSRVAAELVGQAGGLDALARIPSCNTQVIGQDKGSLQGFSSASALRHMGIVYNCDLVQKATPDLRRKAVRVVAGRLTLCARVDAHGGGTDVDGSLGKKYYGEIDAKVEKWIAPPPGKLRKALPKPDDKPRRRRGGRRARKMKERYGMTEMNKQASRRAFGEAITDEYADDAMGRDLGMLGRDGSGALRTQAKKSNYTSKKLRRAVNTGGSGASGLASSVAFTPVQGLELVNPDAAEKKAKEANDKYFGTQTGFYSVVRK